MGPETALLGIFLPSVCICVSALIWQDRQLGSENARLRREHDVYVTITQGDIKLLKDQLTATQIAVKKMAELITRRTGKDPLSAPDSK